MEKSQEQIRFENMYVDSIGGWWSEYPLGSAGNIIHWIYVYTMLRIADSVTVGENEVQLYEKPLARFVIDEERQMPIFIILNNDIDPNFYENQEIFLQGLKDYPEFIKQYAELIYNIKR